MDGKLVGRGGLLGNSRPTNLTRAKRISGWMSSAELEFIAKFAKESTLIIEIGCYYGRTTMALADNTDGVVIAVDPYMGEYPIANQGVKLDFDEPVYQDFLYNLSEHLTTGKVVHHRTTINDIPIYPADFAFIDGDHTYEGCLNDIRHCMLMVRSGIIAGHDWGTPGFPGVNKAVRELLGEPNIVDTLWCVKRG
jgi:hypothetical protein